MHVYRNHNNDLSKTFWAQQLKKRAHGDLFSGERIHYGSNFIDVKTDGLLS